MGTLVFPALLSKKQKLQRDMNTLYGKRYWNSKRIDFIPSVIGDHKILYIVKNARFLISSTI